MVITKSETRKLLSAFKASEDNMRWLVENYDPLKQRYGDSWVAVRQGTVVAHDKDYGHLLKVLGAVKTSALMQTVAIDLISSVPQIFFSERMIEHARDRWQVYRTRYHSGIQNDVDSQEARNGK